MTQTDELEQLSDDFQLAEDTILEHAEIIGRNDGDREPWLKLRKTFIGGADAAGTANLSQWESPFSVFTDKVTPDWSEEENERMKWGRRLEEPIGLGISEDTGIPVKRYPFVLRSKQWPWMGVDLDFLAPRSCVEVKNVGSYMASEWDDGAVPLRTMIQGQHACAVTGMEGVHFFPLIGGNEPRPTYIARNDQMIEDLVDVEQKFWQMVKDLTPPQVDGSRATREALARVFGVPDAGSEVELHPDVLGLRDRRAELKASIKAMEAEVDQIENTMKFWLGRAEIGKVNGETIVTWKTIAGGDVSYYRKPYRRLYVAKRKAGE